MPAEDEESTRKRLSKALRMNQEPKDRIWSVIFAMAILVFILGGIVVESRIYLSREHTLGFERGAAYCLTVVVDNDRDFELPEYCKGPDLVIYYPEDVCSRFFPDSHICGSEEGG